MRISPANLDTLPWYLKPIFRAQRRRYGAALDSARVWARSPRLLFGLSVLYGIIDRKRSPLDPALRSLVTVRVSQINHCPFCIDVNSATLLERGMPPDKLQELEVWRTSDLFGEGERVALEFAEAMTVTERSVDDALFDRMRETFDEAAIVELAGLIAFQNMSSKFNSALAVPPQGFCVLPDTMTGRLGSEGHDS